MFNMFI